MPPPLSDSSAEPGPVQVRLGPSAAGRCRRRIHLDAADPRHRSILSAAGQRTVQELLEHRTAVLTTLTDLHPAAGPGADWRREPRAVVIAPEMTTATRSGAADLLLWADDGYVPVIVRAHRTRETGTGSASSPLARPLDILVDRTHRSRRQRADRLALAHHYRQLVELGCASTTARGGVIGRGSPTDGAGRPEHIGAEDDGAVIIWHDLDPAALLDYDRRFADRLAVAEAAVTGGPALAQPSRVAECRRCHWWPVCSPELHAAQDISLLLSGGDVQVARAAGAPTIPLMATFPREELGRLPLTGTSGRLAQVRARAWQLAVPLARTGAQAGVRRADVELDIDAESYGEDGPYLWGAHLSGADVGVPLGYRAFVTWDPLPAISQAQVFAGFFDHLQQVAAAARERGLSFAVFCYGRAAEERWMQGLARRYGGVTGVPDVRQVTDFTASPAWVDLLQEIKKNFLPTGSLRLKDIADRLGFSWRDPEPGGENSMAWYRAVVPPAEPGVGGPPFPRDDARDGSGGRTPAEHRVAAADHPMAERILRYNEDDVLATLAVRRWISEHLPELPTVAELEGPSWRMSSRFH